MKTSPLARLAYPILLLLVMGYALISLRGPRGLHGLTEKQQQIKALEKRNADLVREIEEKRRYLTRLTDNPSAQELEIRRDYKLVQPKDKVYMLAEPAPATPAPTHP